MSVSDSISNNGKYTITNLKTATGIADDRLSAHRPNGAGNQASFGDFVCKAVGYQDPNTPDVFTRLLRPEKVNGTETDAAGSYDSQNPPYYVFSNIDELSAEPSSNPDTFTIRIDLYQIELGEYFPEQIAKNDPGGIELTDGSGIATLISKNIITDGNGNQVAIDFKFELTGFASGLNLGFTYNGNLNTNADNTGKSSTDGEGNSLPENAGLVFRTLDVDTATPLIEKWHVRVKDNGLSVAFDFNVGANGNNLGESFVVYDPADNLNAAFYVYDLYPSNNSPYANDEEPDFLSSNHFEQNVEEFQESEGNRSITFYCEIRGQSGNTVDVVLITIDENETGIWDGTESCYEYTTSTARNQATISNPQTMNFNGTC